MHISKAIIALLFVANFINFSLKAQIGTIEFEQTNYDFGQIVMKNGPATCEFIFKNTGTADLKILAVKTTCGCTAPDYPKYNIKPGASDKIKITYNPEGRPGPFHKSITVVINNPDLPNTVLFIKGFVIQESTTAADLYPIKMGNLRMVSNQLALNDITTSQIKLDSLGIFNEHSTPMTMNFEQVPSHLKLWLSSASIEPNSAAYIYIQYDAKLKNDYGLVYDRVAMRTNDTDQPIKILNISARISQDYSNLTPNELKKAPKIVVKENKYDFGTVATGTIIRHTFEFTNEGKSDLKILKIKTSCGCTAAAVTQNNIKKGKSSSIDITFETDGRTGRQIKHITLITNDPTNPEINLEVSGELK